MRTNLITYSACLDALARHFRVRTSRAEERLWRELKGRRLGGYRFERRCEVDRYTVDFYCSELQLAVDILDADRPWRGPRGDEERTIRLRLFGVAFLPFGEDEVLYNLDGVVSRIRQTIRYLPRK